MCKEWFLQPVDTSPFPNILSAQYSLGLGFVCLWRKHAPRFYTKILCIFCTLFRWPWSKAASLFSTYRQADVIIALCARYISSEITHFSWRLIWQRESRKTDLFTLSGWQHVDCLTFVKKKFKKALCEVVSKVLLSRFRKSVFFTIEKCDIYSSLADFFFCFFFPCVWVALSTL